MEKSFQTNMTYASAASKCVGTCDNGLGINLIEAGNREADDTAVGILDVRLACINLPAVNKTLEALNIWKVSCCNAVQGIAMQCVHSSHAYKGLDT